MVMVSSEGGVEIEETARNYPEKIFSREVKPFQGLRAYQVRELAKKLAFKGKPMLQLASIISSLYQVFKSYDALIAEINPLPGICGRVCTHPCEEECQRQSVDEPVAIDLLKRFAAD